MSDVDEFCLNEHISRYEFYDACALHLAKGHLDGTLNFDLCDGMVNLLIGLVQYDVPEIFMKVFEAFDQGEYTHRNDSSQIDPRIVYTIPLLKEAMLLHP
jgi:hypothetical protein